MTRSPTWTCVSPNVARSQSIASTRFSAKTATRIVNDVSTMAMTNRAKSDKTSFRLFYIMCLNKNYELAGEFTFVFVNQVGHHPWWTCDYALRMHVFVVGSSEQISAT